MDFVEWCVWVDLDGGFEYGGGVLCGCSVALFCLGGFLGSFVSCGDSIIYCCWSSGVVGCYFGYLVVWVFLCLVFSWVFGVLLVRFGWGVGGFGISTRGVGVWVCTCWCGCYFRCRMV